MTGMGELVSPIQEDVANILNLTTEKEMEKIYKKIMEKRHSGGNWLPYFNSWYVFCDGVICCN